MRIVIELKRDANANVVLNQLYKNTQLQESLVSTCSRWYNPKTKNMNPES